MPKWSNEQPDAQRVADGAYAVFEGMQMFEAVLTKLRLEADSMQFIGQPLVNALAQLHDGVVEAILGFQSEMGDDDATQRQFDACVLLAQLTVSHLGMVGKDALDQAEEIAPVEKVPPIRTIRNLGQHL